MYEQKVLQKYEKKLYSPGSINLFTMIVALNTYPSLKVLGKILDCIPANFPEKKTRTALNLAVKASAKGPLYLLKTLLTTLSKDNPELADQYLKAAEEIDDYKFEPEDERSSKLTLRSKKLEDLLTTIRNESEGVEEEGVEAVAVAVTTTGKTKKRRFALEEAEEAEEGEEGEESAGEEAEEAEKVAKILAGRPKLKPLNSLIYGKVLKGDILTDDVQKTILETATNGFLNLLEADKKPHDTLAMKKPKTIFVGADVPYFCTDYEWDQEAFVGCSFKDFPTYLTQFLLELFVGHDGMAIIFLNADYQLDETKALLKNFIADEPGKWNVKSMTNLYIDRIKPSTRSRLQRNRQNLISNVETALQVR